MRGEIFMNIKVVGKDLEVTDAIRDYSEKKIKKIEKRTQKKVAKMKKEKVKKPNIIFVQLESQLR